MSSRKAARRGKTAAAQKAASVNRRSAPSRSAKPRGALAPPAITYREAGVDIDRGDEIAEVAKRLAEKTARPGLLSGVGGFASLFQLDVARYHAPVLVTCTDGVGTKLKIAFLTGVHHTVGQDLVAMSVNDLIVCGAEPLVFLDYFATGRLNKGVAAEVLTGIAEACQLAGCVLAGGETAEMPDLYQRGEYDLAGFAVGAVEASALIDGRTVQPGDPIIGIFSSGFHSNGYSLLRRVVFDRMKLTVDSKFPGAGKTVGEVLLTPTYIYAEVVQALLAGAVTIKAMAHITGGGLPGNLARNLPPRTAARVDPSRWDVPEIFQVVAQGGPVDRDEMWRAFNMGIGFALVTPPGQTQKAMAMIHAGGFDSRVIGEVVASDEPEAQVSLE